MKPKLVEKLERTLEETIGNALSSRGLKKLPYRPSQHVLHMMAKAATAAYEAAVAAQQEEDESADDD